MVVDFLKKGTQAEEYFLNLLKKMCSVSQPEELIWALGSREEMRKAVSFGQR